MTIDDRRKFMTPYIRVTTPKMFGIYINQKKARLRGGYKRK